MAPAGDPQAVGALLRSHRRQLSPGEVGLPDGVRRRTAGLRREEVAQLANLSTTYYTFLEQGRPVRPSEQVLDALSTALRLSGAERNYLRLLAYGSEAPTAGSEQVAPWVVALLDRLGDAPSLVKGRRWDVLAANDAARELFACWDSAQGEPNLLRWMFTSPAARQIYLEWEPEARAMLGRFRVAAARHRDEPDFDALILELQEASGLFRQWWPEQYVVGIGSGSKLLRHPTLGPQRFDHVVLQGADQPEQTVVSYSPAAGDASAHC